MGFPQYPGVSPNCNQLGTGDLRGPCGVTSPLPNADGQGSYHNEYDLECNGDVIIDESFTSEAECIEFRDRHTIICDGNEILVNC